MAHLVDILNGQGEIGLGYQNLYRMADTSNGADVDTAVDEFGTCVVTLAAAGMGISGLSIPSVEESCPSPADLAGWHLTAESLELDITVAGSLIDIPEIAGCSDFADANGLDVLGTVCGSSGEEQGSE